jgi:putative ABC transport system substrate-binding protein
MNRRAFIALIGGNLLASSSRASAQTARRTYRLGWLQLGERAIPKQFWDAMRELGWIEGQNIQVEPRYAVTGGQLPALAAELVRLKVDLIVADSGFAARAAKEATATIPIVFVIGADPVATGLVSSLARPGGNLTGFTLGLHDDKMLEMLKMAIPGLLRVAVPSEDYPSRLEGAAKRLGVEVKGTDVRSPDDIARFIGFARRSVPAHSCTQTFRGSTH